MKIDTNNPLINHDGSLKEEAKEKIKKYGTNVECECPTHLMVVAKAINDFQKYETSCLINDIKQKDIHEWLLAESQKIEKYVSNLIVELMRREGFIDNYYNFQDPNIEGKSKIDA